MLCAAGAQAKSFSQVYYNDTHVYSIDMDSLQYSGSLENPAVKFTVQIMTEPKNGRPSITETVESGSCGNNPKVDIGTPEDFLLKTACIRGLQQKIKHDLGQPTR